VNKFVWGLFYVVLVISVALLLYGIYTLVTIRGSLDKIPPGFSFGPPDADVHVVGFVDYSCDHCRVVDPILMEAIKQDGHVRYSPLVISRGTPAEYAMKLTYSASLQNKYKEAFTLFMTDDYNVSAGNLTDVALRLGIDEETLRAGVEEPMTERLIDMSYRTFSTLGGEFTPTFFIGADIKYLPYNVPTVEEWLKLFDEARGK
jgi:protein-disulfide isomerase